METKIALLVIYNHRYDKNIGKIEKLLEGKFSYIYHVIPFYDGDKENVITVYDTSYCFGGYIAQAYERVKKMEFTHYFVIADDMLLSPKINEDTLFEVLGIDKDTNYTPEVTQFGTMKKSWIHSADAVFFTAKKTGAEIYNVLPPREQAMAQFKRLNIDSSEANVTIFWKAVFCRRILLKSLFQIGVALGRYIKHPFRKYELEYPMVGGYVDVCLITARSMPYVCKYIGAFSATSLFVEIGLPTAIVLASEKLKVESQLKLKGQLYWDEEIPVFEKEYNNDLDKLIENYPEDVSYIHPVKLSRWRSRLF